MTKYVPFKLDDETYDTIRKLACKTNSDFSKTIRRLISIGLQSELSKDNIDFIREQIGDEIKSICQPQFERIAKLEAKIAYQTVASFYLQAYIMDSILPANKRVVFDAVKKKSRLMAIAYLKLSETEFTEFAKSEDMAVDMLDLK